MEVEGAGQASKRKPDIHSPPTGPADAVGAQQPVVQQHVDSSTSSDKRARLGSSPAPPPHDDAVSSSLLPIHPLTAEAAERLPRLGSPELEVEEEADALQRMLAPTAQPQPQATAAHPGAGTALESGGWWEAEDLAYPAAGPVVLAEQLSGMQLGAGEAGSTHMDDDAGIELPGSDGEGGSGPLTSPQAAAMQATQAPQPGEQQQQQSGGADPLIRSLAAQQAAAPLHMLPLEALERNPLLARFQAQRAQVARCEQTARAVAAAAALREQLSSLEEAEMEEDLDEVELIH